MSFFTEDLLASIKLRSLAPISQSTFSDSDLLSLASEEMRLRLTADLVSDREDFFLDQETQNIIAGVDHYSIPSRAVGSAIKEVLYIGPNIKRPLQRVDVERAQFYNQADSMPTKFYFLGDEIVLLPSPVSSTGTITITFPAAPSDLVLTSSCAKVTAVANDGVSAKFTVNTDLTASLAVGQYVDLLSATAPFKLWKYRAAITQITSTEIDVALADAINPAGTIETQVGDYICPSGFSNIPQIPIPYHPVLAQMVVVRLMAALGDAAKLGAAKQDLAEMRSDALKLIRNRVENSSLKITGRGQLIKAFR